MSLQFICPGCGGQKLESIETDVMVVSVITNINENGDFDYEEQNHCEGGRVTEFHCFECGYILKNDGGETINENLEVVEWIKRHCPQNK